MLAPGNPSGKGGQGGASGESQAPNHWGLVKAAHQAGHRREGRALCPPEWWGTAKAVNPSPGGLQVLVCLQGMAGWTCAVVRVAGLSFLLAGLSFLLSGFLFLVSLSLELSLTAPCEVIMGCPRCCCGCGCCHPAPHGISVDEVGE